MHVQAKPESQGVVSDLHDPSPIRETSPQRHGTLLDAIFDLSLILCYAHIDASPLDAISDRLEIKCNRFIPNWWTDIGRFVIGKSECCQKVKQRSSFLISTYFKQVIPQFTAKLRMSSKVPMLILRFILLQGETDTHLVPNEGRFIQMLRFFGFRWRGGEKGKPMMLRASIRAQQRIKAEEDYPSTTATRFD
ncbi:hypothetical protein MRB53_020979 [Persea americana]|uniref:Uncharacterized protein n=1 Tax=Persea americana TaxID=3435 RepID=A0ACC2L2F0_PERAE|nr:hypothetical protein MRB53_020979 [Persea americana]